MHGDCCRRRRSCGSIAATSPSSTRAGVALALSTERDTLVRVTYPDQVSWLTVADRFRTWIIGSLWVLGTIGFLFGAATDAAAPAGADGRVGPMPLSPSDRALGDLLVARNIITLPQLDEAVHLAETWNVRLTDAVLSRAWTPPDELYRGVAFHFDLPFVDLVNEPPDRALLRAEDADFYARTADHAVAAARRTAAC